MEMPANKVINDIKENSLVATLILISLEFDEGVLGVFENLVVNFEMVLIDVKVVSYVRNSYNGFQYAG